MMIQVEGFVLSGGASRRMGSDKAALAFGGSTLALRAFDTLKTLSQNVWLVGDERFSGVPIVPDVFKLEAPGVRASIVGLHSALCHSSTEWIAVLACDMPFVDAELFRRFVNIASHSRQELDAIIPADRYGKLQPFAALYRCEVCLPAVEAMLSKEDFRLTELTNRLKTHIMAYPDYGDLDADDRLFFNVNTPEDYAVALQWLNQ